MEASAEAGLGVCPTLHVPTAPVVLLLQSSHDCFPPGDSFLIKLVEKTISCSVYLICMSSEVPCLFFGNVCSSSGQSWLTAGSPEPAQGSVLSPWLCLTVKAQCVALISSVSGVGAGGFQTTHLTVSRLLDTISSVSHRWLLNKSRDSRDSTVLWRCDQWWLHELSRCFMKWTVGDKFIFCAFWRVGECSSVCV